MKKIIGMVYFSFFPLIYFQSSYTYALTEKGIESVLRYHQVAALNQLAKPRNSPELSKPIEVLLRSLQPNLQLKEQDRACTQDLVRVVTSLKENWAQRMLDADAKPPSGMMDGNLVWTGDYYECSHVYAPPSNTSSFTGRYCMLSWLLKIYNTSIPVTTGVCVPSTCDAVDLYNLTNIALLMDRTSLPLLGSIELNLISGTCKEEKKSFDAAAIGTMFLLCVFALLLFVGTVKTVVDNIRTKDTDEPSVDYKTLDANDKNVQFSKGPKDSALWNFLNCFSVLTNSSKILQTNAKGELQCVHGIRFLSMTWVILGHTYAFATLVGFSGNTRQVFDAIDNLPFQVVIQGPFSVDSFFLLSGFLLCYIFLKQANSRQGKISWIFFYCHRYWRLTPVYAIVLAFYTALAIYMADGPFWPKESIDMNCRQTWWWNLLYINNFVEQTRACMNWSWYLANDMQFYVISPIFLYALWRRPRIGISIICVLLLSSWIASGVISYHYDMMPGYTTATQTRNIQEYEQSIAVYFEKLYIKPYTRIGPYLIGVILGYLIASQTEQKKPLSKVTQCLGWFLAASAALAVVYGLYNSNPGPIISMLYNALSRSLFAASLAWVIYACLTGHGGLVNSMLSCSAMVPLSRLTYCAYLVHPIIILGFFMSVPAPLQITHSLMVSLFLGFLLMSYATALVCSLAFESPMMAVEKQVLTLLEKSRSPSS